MRNKTSKQFFFESQLKWLKDSRAALSARDAIGEIYVATPPEFGGEEEKPWTPEHLFLSSICSCFMSTFLAYAKKHKLAINDFKCEVIGQIEVVQGKYKFTNINLYPKVYIETESLKDAANTVLKKTQQYCLISNSVNATIYYHSEVIIAPITRQDTIPIRKIAEPFSLQDAKNIGEQLGIDFKKYRIEEFRKGLAIELEHGRIIPETNITNDDKLLTAKIAWLSLRGIEWF